MLKPPFTQRSLNCASIMALAWNLINIAWLWDIIARVCDCLEYGDDMEAVSCWKSRDFQTRKNIKYIMNIFLLNTNYSNDSEKLFKTLQWEGWLKLFEGSIRCCVITSKRRTSNIRTQSCSYKFHTRRAHDERQKKHGLRLVCFKALFIGSLNRKKSERAS